MKKPSTFNSATKHSLPEPGATAMDVKSPHKEWSFGLHHGLDSPFGASPRWGRPTEAHHLGSVGGVRLPGGASTAFASVSST